MFCFPSSSSHLVKSQKGRTLFSAPSSLLFFMHFDTAFERGFPPISF